MTIHRTRSLTVGIVVGDESWRFFDDIYRDLQQHFQVKVFEPAAGFGPDNPRLADELSQFLTQCDVAFFEWAASLLALATRSPPPCVIITRLHRFELFTWAEQIEWTRVAAVIFINPALAEKFRTYWRDQPKKIAIIPGGVSTDRFKPYDMGPTHKIGTLCWLSPRKRVYELILCFHELRTVLPQLRLSIAGGRHRAFLDYYDALLGLVEKLGLSDRVEFVGEPEHIPAWYRTIDIFVSNSYSEGLQASLLEAMASACHCLSHAWQGAEAVLPPEQIFTTDGELKAKIVSFYTAKEEVQGAWQIEMRERAIRDYDYSIVSQKISAFIEEVMFE